MNTLAGVLARLDRKSEAVSLYIQELFMLQEEGSADQNRRDMLIYMNNFGTVLQRGKST